MSDQLKHGIMKRTLLTILASAAIAMTSAAQSIPLKMNNTSFKAGEKIVYDAYFNLGLIWVHAAKVTFTVQNTVFQNNFAQIPRYFKSVCPGVFACRGHKNACRTVFVACEYSRVVLDLNVMIFCDVAECGYAFGHTANPLP